MKKFAQMINGDIIDITPSDLKGCTFIADALFMNKPIINSVQLPNTVKTIGSSAFYQIENLTSISIPDSVESIGESAFSYSRNITNHVIINNADIGKSAFGNCSGIPMITLGENVKSIGASAFSGSTAITDAYFRQPSGMAVSLPEAGSSTGIFYVKTARSMNIYTENETIKSYGWASDNITPTFYHLDGTPW